MIIITLAGNNAYLYSLSTGWRNWWDLVGQHLCHVCTTQSNHQQQTAGGTKIEDKQAIKNTAVRLHIYSVLQWDNGCMHSPAWHSCPTSPPQTTSCFPCHFPGGGHLSGQLLSLLCLSRLQPFSPSSHPGKQRFLQWRYQLNTPSTLTTEGLKNFKRVRKTWVSFTFPFAAFVLLPSGSSEKSVSDENRVSVSLVSTKNNLD